MQLKAIAQDKGQSGPGNNMFDYEKIHLPQRVVAELAMAKTERAIYSDRQLYEQMVDFWFNHFNVYAQKGQDVWLLTAYERDAIRPHAMGRFRDLLEATAKSPAMLFYLDNWLSVDPTPGSSFRRSANSGSSVSACDFPAGAIFPTLPISKAMRSSNSVRIRIAA